MEQSVNKIDPTTKLRLLSAKDYFGWIRDKLINMKPVYQRPYTYQDEVDGKWGNVWQKTLIKNFLEGGFIQPIHLLYRGTENSFMYWIIDGGHRTKTLYSFFVEGWLKTPTGFELEWNGDSFAIGNMTWKEICVKHPQLLKYTEELNFWIVSYDKTVTEGRKLFLTLNDLHPMSKMEKLNPFEHHLSDTVRYFGDVTLSPLPMFNEYKSDGKLVHINMKTIKRVTDELVLWVSDFIEKGGTIKKYEEPSWSLLEKWYNGLDESPTMSKKWKKGSVKNTHLENLLLKLQELVLESDRNRTGWKKNVLMKMAILINHFYEKNGYNWNSLDIDWKEFNKDVDLVMSDVSKKNKIHNPYSRYGIVNNEVVVVDNSKTDLDESYTIDRVFTGGSRIDDIEFWFYHMINSGKTFGITKVQNRSFSSSQKLEMFTGKCERCGCDITLSESEGDHRVPVKYDGETEVYNGDSLCKDCNRDKGSSVSSEDLQKSLIEYIDGGGRDTKVIHKLSGLETFKDGKWSKV
tara:strand:- start:58 stop:1608 length:1551 start_codon:yes stop_codon:yes gene_type:complete